MKQTLLSFTQQPLFDAASAFLGKLGIKHGEYDTKEPLPLTAFFDDRMPQYLQDAQLRSLHLSTYRQLMAELQPI